MESIRKQASKLREQVAKQQQAVLRQLGHLSHEAFMDDEAELQCHQQLQNLYNSTRDAKHFQRNILRGIEAFVSISSKQMEMVCEPLRAQIRGAPLEDARHLAHRYEKLWQEVESQEAEVLRRRLKSRDSSISVESSTRLQLAEARLSELKSMTMALGKEATAAMLSVEVQQQQLTFMKLLTMIEAERTYHQKALEILEKLHAEITLEKQPKEFSLPSEIMQREVYHQYVRENIDSNGSGGHGPIIQNEKFFIAKAVHSFDAQADGELSLSADDYVMVRQVAPTGWSEGECNGISGWFPSAYVERQEKAPASKVMEATSEP